LAPQSRWQAAQWHNPTTDDSVLQIALDKLKEMAGELKNKWYEQHALIFKQSSQHFVVNAGRPVLARRSH
jgi:hypothetical protein